MKIRSLTLASLLLAACLQAAAQDNPYNIDNDCYKYFLQAESLVGKAGFYEANSNLLKTARAKGDTKSETLYYVEELKNLVRFPSSPDNDAKVDIAHKRLKQVAQHYLVVAIGETGLDSLKGAPLDLQQQVMQEVINIAAATGKPLIIHCVRTSQQVLKLWRDNPHAHNVAWVIHGFRGNENVARELLDAGFYLSFGAKYNEAALAITPLDHLLLETDDEPPAVIDQVIKAVARVKQCSQWRLRRTVRRTALRIIKYK